jgi:hypothetical protein
MNRISTTGNNFRNYHVKIGLYFIKPLPVRGFNILWR